MATSAFRSAFTTETQVSSKMTFTDNGALTHSNTGSALLDFFTKVMARDKSTAMSDTDICTHMTAAWAESPILALKLIANLRDFRGDSGKGERHASVVCWKWLLDNHHEQVLHNMKHIPFYGRWEDLLDIFCNTPYQHSALMLFRDQLMTDLSILNAPSTDDVVQRCSDLSKLSLAPKWAPSEKCKYDKAAKRNKNPPVSHLLARMLYDATDGTPSGLDSNHGGLMRWYRTTYITPLRNALDIVETHLCKKEFDKIDFSKVPGVALKMYSKNAFPKHVPEQFAEWQRKVASGDAKINSNTVDPYSVVEEYVNHTATEAQKPTLEAFYHDQIAKFKAKFLKKYGADHIPSSVVVCDTSGSMTQCGGTPLNVAISMAIWISSLAETDWKDIFFTFNHSPEIIDLSHCTGLEDRVATTKAAPWGGNTDLQATFDLILSRAVSRKLTPEQMPRQLVIVSDMQFDAACGSHMYTNLDAITAKFRNAGYPRPDIVFWNVAGTSTGAPATADERGIIMLSGFCKANINLLLEGDDFPTPREIMMKAINDERYDRLTIV